MYAPDRLDPVDAARLALLAYAGAGLETARRFVEVPLPFPEEFETPAIHLLDAAGAIEAVFDADLSGSRTWRVRCVTPEGHDVARVIRDDLVWSRLRGHLSRRGEPFALLVQGYRDNLSVGT